MKAFHRTKHIHENEALPGVRGNRVKGAFISGKQGQILRGSGKQKQNWGTEGTHFQFCLEQGNKPIYFRGTREQIVSHWEGLENGSEL